MAVGHKTTGNCSPITGDINYQETINTLISENKNETNKFKSEIRKTIWKHWILWGVVIILLGVIIFCHFPKIDIKENYVGTILGFIGILATFIVISNYIQVKDVEIKFDFKINEVKDETNKKFNEISKDLEETKQQVYSDIAYSMIMDASSNQNLKKDERLHIVLNGIIMLLKHNISEGFGYWVFHLNTEFGTNCTIHKIIKQDILDAITKTKIPISEGLIELKEYINKLTEK